jgi:LysR family transcriptional regulator, glycine cleavage system transcriptional activator
MKFSAPSMVELHAFLGVCRAGSIRRAAEQLCVSQAAVSRAVARLEGRLGITLFDRSAQGVTPNAQAQALRERIEPSLNEIERAFGEFGRTGGRRHVLRLSVVPTLGTRWLLPRLQSFQALHPGMRVDLRPYRVDDDFRRDDVDVWIALKQPGRRWPRGVAAHYLLGREITPVCTPAIAKRLGSPDRLLKQTLLHHANYPENWRLWLTAAGVDAAKVELGSGFDLAHHLIAVAAAGMGVAVLQPCLIERELAAGELVLPFELKVSTGRGYHLCTRSAGGDTPAVEAFSRWVTDMARDGS